MKKKIILLMLCLCIMPTWLSAQHKLTFKDKKFVIAQFTDLHWTPTSPKCAETTKTIRAVLETEHPMLAILTGDIVTAAPAIDGWRAIIRIFNEARIPFVVTMGNHDAEHMAKKNIYDLLLTSPYYVGAKGPEDIMGCGNCVIPVYGSDNQQKVAALLYCIDSNDYQPDKLYGEYDWIHFNQIEWYRNQSRSYTAANGGKPLPALAFFHIPLPEYNNLTGDTKTYGYAKDEGVAASNLNSGMFTSFIDMKDVMGVFVGHDHNNDYIGIDKGVALGYGRATGADAYGVLEPGARIIQMYEGKAKFDTWVTTKTGREPAYFFPSGLNAAEAQSMIYLPAVKKTPGKQGVAYTYYEGNCKCIADIATCKKVKEGTLLNFSISNAAAKDHFAYEFRTLFNIPERGIYRFYTFSDDGSILYVDGKKVVDNDGGHSARRAEGKVALEKGFHEIHLQYFENYMGQELEVGYTGKDIEEMVLPANLLFVPD